MEGSTRLLQQLGERYTRVLAECRSLLRKVFIAYNSHEVDTQRDAFFVAFARATDAAAASVTIQRALADHSWHQDVIVRVRIGLHTGEPILTADGYIGVDVHHERRTWWPDSALTNNPAASGAAAVRRHLPAGPGRASSQGLTTAQPPLSEDQMHRASCLHLIMAAIAAWNTVYLTKAIATLRKRGEDIPEATVAYIAPLGWEHIR